MKLPKVLQEVGISHCGLFALAYAYELATNRNHGLVEFDQKKIHDNFNQAVLTDKLTSFPIANQYLSNTTIQISTLNFNS